MTSSHRAELPAGVRQEKPAILAGPSAAVVQWTAGVMVALLGAAVMLAWWLRFEPAIRLQPHQRGMVFNTAVGLLLAGLALSGMKPRPARTPAWSSACSAALAALSLTTLFEHATGTDLGVDWPRLHAWFDDGNPSPGRMASVTALCFLLTAGAIVLGARARTRGIGLLVKGLTFFVLGVGAMLLAAYAAGLSLEYSGYALGFMAAHTAAGFVLLGVGLWASWRDTAWNRAQRGEDSGIAALATWGLVLFALAASLPGLVAQQRQTATVLANGLQLALRGRIDLLTNTLELRSTRAALIANRPSLIEAMRILRGDPGNVGARNTVRRQLESFAPFGFSSIAIALPDGTLVDSIGHPAEAPEVRLRVQTGYDSTLLWAGGLVLQQQEAVRDDGSVVGTVLSQQDLRHTTATLLDTGQIGATGEMLLCQRQSSAFQCFPTRLTPHPFELPLSPKHTPLLVQLAQTGRADVGVTRDYRGQVVVGAFSPVGNLDLVAVLKVDAAELYAPLARQLPWTALLLGGLTVAASWLLRRRIRPLATALVRAEQQARERSEELGRSEAYLRNLYDDSPDAVLVVDGTGRIARANSRAESLFGYPPGALAGEMVEALIPERVREVHRRHRGAFASNPRQRQMGQDLELIAQRADGVQFPVDVMLSPLQADGGGQTIAIVRDVTERKEREARIAAALKEKELLLGEIHHRVKNNLQIVHSLLDLQSGGITDPRMLATLRDSQNRVQSMALIHQTLYQSKDFSQVDFVAFLETLSGHLVGSYRVEGIGLVLDTQPVQLSIRTAIPCGLIVNELVTNAIKHGFPNGGRGTITIGLVTDADRAACLTVADDGVGIPDDLGAVHTGTMGMQVVFLLSEQIGGTITVQRRNPTRFELRFPIGEV